MIGTICIELIHGGVQWKFRVKREQEMYLLFVANGLVFWGVEDLS
jgi:hypothetical protein